MPANTAAAQALAAQRNTLDGVLTPLVTRYTHDPLGRLTKVVDAQGHGTDAITRVLIETADGAGSWVTVGVGANVIEASWGALMRAG